MEQGQPLHVYQPLVPLDDLWNYLRNPMSKKKKKKSYEQFENQSFRQSHSTFE